MPHLFECVHGGPVELPDAEAAKLEIRGERLWGVEDVWILPVRHEGALFECILFPLDPLAKIFERRSLSSIVDLFFLPLGIPFNAKHLR